MQYLIYALDNKNSLNKRLSVREAHINLGDKLKAKGKLIFGAALLDSDGNMNGSILVGEFKSKGALKEEWLNIEPYVTGGVWDMDIIKIEECKVGPSFIEQN